MQILLPLIYAIIFFFLILKMKFFDCQDLSKPQLIGLFILKIVAGISGYFLYTYYYAHSDSYLFFEGSKNMFDRFLGNSGNSVIGWDSSFDDSFYNNTRVIIFINFLIQFLSFNNVFVHILFFCFFSFVGLTALYKTFYQHFPDKKVILVLGLFLVPSVLFWTSGIYKETVAIFCIGLILYITDFGLARSISSKAFIFLILLFTLLFFVKIYIAASILPLLIINFLISKTGNTKYLLRYLLLFVSFILIIHLLSKTSSRLNVYQLLADKQAKSISEAQGGIFLESDTDFIRLDYNDSTALIPRPDSTYFIRGGSNYLLWKLDNMKDTAFIVGSKDSAIYKLLYKVQPAKSALDVKKMNPSFLGLIQKIPSSIANVFVQPTLFKIKSALQLFSWIENIWLLLLMVLASLFFDKKIFLKKEVLFFCLVFALIQFTIIGITTPVVGAMVRYKVTALPFLFVITMLCVDGEKLLSKLKRTKN